MRIDQFPHQYKTQRMSQAQKDISAENERCSFRKKAIQDGISKPADTGEWALICGAIGTIVGFFVCCSMCVNDTNSDSAFGTWVLLAIAGAILGAVLAGTVNARHDSTKQNADKECVNEQARCSMAIREINKKAEQDIETYQAEFEAEAQNMSVRYAESALATEVINWMTEGFSRTIDAANRRSYVESISVPFSFNVHTDKIICNLGTYDFRIKRCANLTSPVQQTAIARAIASAIQLNITMKYPRDASGTDFVIDIAYSYTDTNVSVIITYAAPNGNYRPVQNW